MLAELLIREAEMRHQDADIERRVARLPAELGDDGRQLVDDGLILMALLERFRERVIAPWTLAVLGDDAARGGFRLREIAQPPVGLRQQVERARVGSGASRDDLGQRVAGLPDVLFAAGVQQGRGVPRFQVEAVARRALKDT